MITDKVRLIVRQVAIKDNNKNEYWALQDWAQEWNDSHQYLNQKLLVQVIGDRLAVVTFFDTDEHAALFKLTHL